MSQLKIYDTTLRDGTQAEEISFSLEDKLRICQKLDDLGIHYIEGGYPGSNSRDVKFFEEVKKLHLGKSRIVSFGSTRKAHVKVDVDDNVQALIKSETQAMAVVAKSWDLHVTQALRISLEENLAMIYDTLNHLKERGHEVFFDAEHFFDGFKNNAPYALKTLYAAQEAGVDYIVLCDTNGGTLPPEIRDIFQKVKDSVKVPLGIHTHNDAEVAVANTIEAVLLGAQLVQGTINGFGERCGNANLCSLLPNLKLKLGINCLTYEQLATLRDTARFVYELANMKPIAHQPYVGKSAFAHKGGLHVSAIQRNPETYEHIRPELVGNKQRVLISDLAGKSNIVYKAKEFNLDLGKDKSISQAILDKIKIMEDQGYQFEGAEASFQLLVKEALGKRKKFFELIGFRVIVEKRIEGKQPISEATVRVNVDGMVEHSAAEGLGPVNALDNALRKALEKFYPGIKDLELLDYKVRILDERLGTKAVTRVLIESGDGEKRWGTVGVSENIIEASWQALVDSVEYKLDKDEEEETGRSDNSRA